MRKQLENEFHKSCVRIEDECNSMGEEREEVVEKYHKLKIGTLEEKVFATELGILQDRIGFLCVFENNIMKYNEIHGVDLTKPEPSFEAKAIVEQKGSEAIQEIGEIIPEDDQMMYVGIGVIILIIIIAGIAVAARKKSKQVEL